MEINPLEYKLEKYSGKNSRFACPECKMKGEFTRYIHPSTGERLPWYVGVCNRKDKCGYSYSNWDYYNSNPSMFDKYQKTSVERAKKLPATYVERSLLDRSMAAFQENNLYKFLCRLLSENSAKALCNTYNVGTSRHWTGASVYWQVDVNNNIRTGKVMLYDPETGKRIHKKQTWVHSLLKLENFNLSQCLFGEHLLSLNDHRDKTIALVESEKTAIIASNFLPSVLWLATGGLDLLNPATNPEKFMPLVGKNVILYPDLSKANKFNGETAYKNWCRKANFLKYLRVNVCVSNLLEEYGSDEEREKGFDIADYLIKEHFNNSI